MKKSHIWRRKFEPLFSFQYVSFWLPFYFNLLLLHSFLVRPSWGSDQSTRKSSPFFEFSRITAYKISIDLVLLWWKNFLFLLPRSWIFLVSLPRSWIFLVSLPRTPIIFLDFFPRFEKSCKILRTWPRKIAKILAKNFKNPRIFLTRNSRRQALGK